MGGVDTEYVVASACSGIEGGVVQAYVGQSEDRAIEKDVSIDIYEQSSENSEEMKGLWNT